MGWWFLVIVAGCGERSELDGPCRTDAGCAEGLVCVKESDWDPKMIHTCQVSCLDDYLCEDVPTDDSAPCRVCLDTIVRPPHCVPTGCTY